MFTEVAQKAHLIIELLLIISDFPIFLNDRGYYETWIFFYPWKILFHVSLYTHPLCWLWFAGISAFMCKSELLEGWWRRLVWVLAGPPSTADTIPTLCQMTMKHLSGCLGSGTTHTDTEDVFSIWFSNLLSTILMHLRHRFIHASVHSIKC